MMFATTAPCTTLVASHQEIKRLTANVLCELPSRPMLLKDRLRRKLESACAMTSCHLLLAKYERISIRGVRE